MTMSPETLAALRGSILKWQWIVDGTGGDAGVDNCPLCKMFYSRHSSYEDNCIGCPVRNASGQPSCHGTPYEEYCDEGGTEAAEAELAFLISLLPPGEPPYLEEDCPGHVVTETNRKCVWCGTHVDSLREETP